MRRILPTIVLTAAIGVSFPALSPMVARAQVDAQTPAETPAATTMSPDAVFADIDSAAVGADAAELLARIGRITDEYRSHRARLAGAAHEDSLVLRLQINTGVDEFIETMPRLTPLFPRNPATDGERDLARRISALYAVVTPVLWDLIAAQRGDIDALRQRRQSTPAAERGGLEFEIVRHLGQLDIELKYASRHLKAMTTLGLDAAADIAVYNGILQELADELTGRIRLGSQRITDYRRLQKERSGGADLGLLLTAARATLDANTRSLSQVVSLMEVQGLDTDQQRTFLLVVSQDLASGLFDARATFSLLTSLGRQVSDWMAARGPTYLIKLLVFAAIMFAGRLLARVVRLLVESSVARARINLSQLLQRTLVSSAHNATLALALMIALSQLGLDLGPLLAGFGVVGFILGFAMQDSLSNFASGLMILFYRPYDVGDLVDISGVFGKVENMSLVSTSILTLDNQKLVVPNSKIWGDVIKNVTDQHIRRVDMVFGISYSDDIPHAEAVLADILAQHDKVLDEPEPNVKLHTLNESSVDFVVRPWVKTEDYWDVYWDVTRAVKMRFDAERITIPFPQRDVHIHGTAAAKEAEG